MLRKNSFTLRIFMALSVLLVVLSSAMSYGIYRYAQNVVRGEILRLNEVTLGQVETGLSLVVEDVMSLANKIGNDSKLISLLSIPDTGVDDGATSDIASLAEGILANHIWGSNNYKNLFEAYVIGYNGLTYSTSAPEKYTQATILENPAYRAALGKNGEAVLVSTLDDPGASGAYRYVFQVVREITDLITQEPCGFLILNISEKTLFDRYAKLNDADRNFWVVNGKGMVLSSKDKRQIGIQYGTVFIPEQGSAVTSKETIHQGKRRECFVLSTRIQGTDWYLVEEISSESALAPLLQIRANIVALTVVCVCVMLLLLLWFARRMQKPIMLVKDNMEQVRQGNLAVRIDCPRNDEFGEISVSFNQMAEQISSLLDAVKRKEKQKRIAELDFLRAQINPHFIYNTLSSIRFFVEMNKNHEAEEMLFHFSKLLRQTLSRSDEFVSVQEELHTIEDYVALQKLRYPRQFQVEYDLQPEAMGLPIPSFILQPIVENSIFYSIHKDSTSHVKITAKLTDSLILLTVSDDGIGMNQEQIDSAFQREAQVSGVGLINVHERIQLNYGPEYGLRIESGEHGGTTVIFTLPA